MRCVSVRCVSVGCVSVTRPEEVLGVKDEKRPPYPQRVVKGD